MDKGKMMTLEQTRLAGYTMQLQLKAMEYERLNGELAKLQEQSMDLNDSRLLKLLYAFKKNNQEIKEINKLLTDLSKS